MEPGYLLVIDYARPDGMGTVNRLGVAAPSADAGSNLPYHEVMSYCLHNKTCTNSREHESL